MYTFNQWTNFLTMMEQRGYDVSEEASMSKDEWGELFDMTDGKFIEPIIFCHENSGKLVMVYFLPPTSVILNHISKFVNDTQNENVTHGIIVHIDEWTCYAKAALNIDSSTAYFEKIHCRFFNINRMEHKLQPEYLLLTKEEGRKLCEKLNTTNYKLPLIKKENTVCTYYGWQRMRGRIVRIASTNHEGDAVITYRCID